MFVNIYVLVMNRPGGETLSTNKSKNLFQVFPFSALKRSEKSEIIMLSETFAQIRCLSLHKESATQINTDK